MYQCATMEDSATELRISHFFQLMRLNFSTNLHGLLGDKLQLIKLPQCYMTWQYFQFELVPVHFFAWDLEEEWGLV